MLPVLCAILLAISQFGISSLAHAQDFAGMYRLVSDVTTAEVPEWGSDCGHRPENHRGSAGRQVRVSADGSQLVVEDRPRMRSDGCWSQNPRVRRTGGSGGGTRWTTECATPNDDYQREEGTYTTTVEGQRILLRDRTVYRWQLRTSACRATLARVITLELVEGTTPPPARDVVVVEPPRDATAPRPPVQARCSLPGPAVRLAIVAGRRSTEPGSRVCFRAQTLDSSGCPSINSGAVPVTWTAARRGGEALGGDGGCVVIPSTLAAGTDVLVTATSGGLQAELTLRIATREELSALVAQSIEEEDAGVSPEIVARAVGAGLATVTPAETPAPPPVSPLRNVLIAGLVAVAVAVLGAAIFVITRKREPAKQKSSIRLIEDSPAQPPTSQPSATDPVAPQDGMRPTPPGGLSTRTRKDEIPIPISQMPIGGFVQGAAALGVKFTAKSSATTPPVAQPPAERPKTKECPACRLHFTDEVGFCPEHGVLLVPIGSVSVTPNGPKAGAPVDLARTMMEGSPLDLGDVVAPKPNLASPPPDAPLVCPTCAKRFSSENIFCGEDGARLIVAS